MLSLSQLTTFAYALFSQVPLHSSNPPIFNLEPPFSPKPINTNARTCPIDSPLSCHNSTAASDSCCFIHPGGQLLSTQFWDTSPAIGPQDSWTLHGLWPDLCDGSYPTYCTEAPTYHNITSIISSSSHPDAPELLNYMLKYWLPNRGSPEHFWQHEWNKHGTCVNTLASSCYDTYSAGDEVLDFFLRAVEVFKSLDTYKALASAGIYPSFYERHTRKDIQEALTAVTGSEVVLGCRAGQLTEVWYSFNVQGSLQTGDFIPAAPAGKGGRGSCPERGIKYLPKGRRY